MTVRRLVVRRRVAEREVSLTSGQAVGDALKRHCGEVLEFDTASRDLAELPQQGVKECLIFYTAAPVKMAKCKVP